MAVRHACAVLVLAAACERATTQPPKPVPPPAPAPTCTIRGGAIHLASQIVLRVHGRPFAWVSDADQVELHVQGDTASATATIPLATLSGDVEAGSLQVRPRTPKPIDGWLEITSATPKSAAGDALAVAVELPSEVQPVKPLAISIACADLTLADAAEIQEQGEVLALRAATTSPLAVAPGGAPFANLVVPPDPPPVKMPAGVPELPVMERTVRVLAHRDGWVQIVIDSWQVRVTGWTPEHAVVPPRKDSATSAILGLLGDHHVPTRERCPAAMPIYVRDGQQVIRVGTSRANAVLPITATRADDLELELGSPSDGGLTRALGGGEPEPLHPFVRRADAGGCTAEPAPSGDPASPS